MQRGRGLRIEEEVAMLKENCRKQMNHIHMLEIRLKQITKKTKLAEQETLIDKIQHSVEYFDHLALKRFTTNTGRCYFYIYCSHRLDNFRR